MQSPSPRLILPAVPGVGLMLTRYLSTRCVAMMIEYGLLGCLVSAASLVAFAMAA